jgi:hypothetical protein
VYVCVCAAGKFARRSLVQRGGKRPSDLHLYTFRANTLYDDNVGLAAANGNCRVPMYYSIILYSTAATAVENQRLVNNNNNNNVIHGVLRTLKLYIILLYRYVSTRIYCCDGTHPYVTTKSIVIIIIMSYALRRRIYTADCCKTCCALRKGSATFPRGLQAAATVMVITQWRGSYIVYTYLHTPYTLIQTDTYYIANITITLKLYKRGHASVTCVPRIETAAADDGLARRILLRAA